MGLRSSIHRIRSIEGEINCEVKIIKNGKELLPCSPEYIKQYNITDEYDSNDVEMLKRVDTQLEQIIEENNSSECIRDYEYYAA